MDISAASYPQTSSTFSHRAVPPGASDPTPPPQDSVQLDLGGGAAAGVIAFAMAGGAHSFARMGSPGLVTGMDAFIGGSIGVQMAEALGKSKLAGAAIGAGTGVALAAAGIYGGWPGALGAAAVAAVARGVVLPYLLNS